MLKLRDWLQFMVNHNVWHLLVGLKRPNRERERAILSEFWTRFRASCPDHEMWPLVDSHQLNTATTVPLVLHGDEGRGRKRSGILIMAWHSVLGFGTTAANRVRTKKPYLSMKLNFSKSAYCHRLLTAVLPKMYKDEIALRDLLKCVVDDALQVMNCGVKDSSGDAYYAVCLQSVGDWAWQVKSGQLKRSYNNVEKRPPGPNSNPKGICHQCCAGQIGQPWENFSSSEPPAWWPTLYTQDAFEGEPALNSIPFIPGKQAGFFGWDLFHCYHLGMGKAFVASCLALASQKMDASRVEDRFALLTELYLTWSAENHRSPYVTCITQASLGWPDTGTYPNGQWSKGHITTALADFFSAWASAEDFTGGTLQDTLLQLCSEANRRIHNAVSTLYENDVWLSSETALFVAGEGLRFLELYKTLATSSFRNGVALFTHLPKSHGVEHIFYGLKDAALSPAHYHLSPLIFSVQMDEDYVGKVSRASRKTSSLQVIQRTLQRSLAATFKHWKREKLISL